LKKDKGFTAVPVKSTRDKDVFITQESIKEVIDKMDAVAVVGDYVRLENRGGRYLGLCPFHNEKTPSFSINPDLKLYHCFGCGAGGTVLNFVMEQDKLIFPEAIEKLAKRFGVQLVYENSGVPEAAKETGSAALTELYSRVAGSFQYWLTKKPEGKAALDYILRRGISSAMIEKFRLGYAPADRHWLFPFLLKRGYSEGFLASSMLFSPKHPQSSFFSNRLMFPINDRHGKTIAFGGRLLTGEGPKYINSPESAVYKKGQMLFAFDLALPEIRKTGEVYIAEGYIDVIALYQAGVTNVVAPLGTAFTDEQARLLRRFARCVNLVFDSDDAGQKAVEKTILICRRNNLEATVVTPNQEQSVKNAKSNKKIKDPADILVEFGTKILQKCAKCVIIDFDYLVSRSKSLFDITSSEGKSRAVAFLFPYLETLDSEVSKDVALGQLANTFGVDREAVRNDYNRRQTPIERAVPKYPQNTQALRMNDELFLLAVVSVNDNLYPKFRSLLSIKEIEDPAAKDLFIALEDCFTYDESGMDALLARISSDDVRQFVIERGASAEFSSNPEQLVADGIKRIKQKRIERKLAKIVTEIRLTRSDSQDERLEELLLEKIHIDAELRRLKENQ
jgi:DNA primase